MLVEVLDFVFLVFIQCNLFIFPEEETDCPKNFTILFVIVVYFAILSALYIQFTLLTFE